MTSDPTPARRVLASALHIRETQNRDTFLLLLNTATMAVAGLAFWLVLTRVLARPPAEIGVGYALIALGTAIGVVAKGGLDTALLRHVPSAGRPDALRLLRRATLAGAAISVAATGVVAATARANGILTHVTPLGWLLTGTIAALLVTAWLQDAAFLAERRVHEALRRNVAASVVRIALPFLLVALAWPHPVALAWCAGIGFGVALAALRLHGLPDRPGSVVAGRTFARTAWRNVSGNAAEFLPGLVLVPIVLAVQGPAPAARFGMAWTIASLLFLASAGIARSCLVAIVRAPPGRHASVVQRAAWHHVLLLGPAAVVAIAAAPFLLQVFGSAYADQGALHLVLLCASIVVVAPGYLYLALLRARERTVPLVLLPAATIGLLLVLTPLAAAEWGLPGAAAAWLAANAPFGVFAALRLWMESREVTRHAAPAFRGPSHAE